MVIGLKRTNSGEPLPRMDYSKALNLRSLAVHLDVGGWRHTRSRSLSETLITLIGNNLPPGLTRIDIALVHFLGMAIRRPLNEIFKGFLPVDLHLSNLGFAGRIFVHIRLGDLSWNYPHIPLMDRCTNELKRFFPAIQENTEIDAEFALD